MVIQHCLAYRNKTSPGAADGGGFDFDGGVTNSDHPVLSFLRKPGLRGIVSSSIRGRVPGIIISSGGMSARMTGWCRMGGLGFMYGTARMILHSFTDCVVYGNTIYNRHEAALSYSVTSARRGLCGGEYFCGR